MPRRSQRNMLAGAASALCGMSLAGAAVAGPHAPPPWWPKSQPFEGDEGAAHFAEFERVCLATDADSAAVAAIAKRDGWSDGGDMTSDGRVTGHGWRFERKGRKFFVGVDSDDGGFITDGPLHGLPMRSCAVQVRVSADGGAIDRLMTMLQTPSCAATDYPEYHGLAWEKRGADYRIAYHFSRMKNSDMLSYMRVGTDARFANVDRRDVCR